MHEKCQQSVHSMVNLIIQNRRASGQQLKSIGVGRDEYMHNEMCHDYVSDVERGGGQI